MTRAFSIDELVFLETGFKFLFVFRSPCRGPTNEIALISRKSFDQMKQLASELPESIANAHVVYQTLESRLADLERQGLIHAKGYWRQCKYFCLYSPSQQGEPRVFRYVGCNPEKIRATQAAMRRATEYEELVAQMARLEDFAEQCSRNLADVLCTLRAFEAINSSSTLLRRLNAKPVTGSPIDADNQFSSEETK